MGKAERIVRFLENRYGPIRHGTRARPFKTLIGCILSQRTREENTARASRQLFAVADTPEKILKLPIRKLEKLVRPAGTYRQKARNIRETSKIILKKYCGKVPKDRGKLLKLPGVGWKTSAIVMSYGHGIPIIAVDTHVNRISKRLGIAKKTDSVEEVREKLQRFFPKKSWFVINLGFVRFGREICRTRRPGCETCPLRSICRYYRGA